MIKEKEFQIFFLYFDNGFEYEDVKLLKPILGKADDYIIGQPDTMCVFVQISPETDRRVEQIKGSLIESKVKNNLKFSLGENRGMLSVESDTVEEHGSLPFGEAINQARDSAIRNIDL